MRGVGRAPPQSDSRPCCSHPTKLWRCKPTLKHPNITSQMSRSSGKCNHCKYYGPVKSTWNQMHKVWYIVQVPCLGTVLKKGKFFLNAESKSKESPRMPLRGGSQLDPVTLLSAAPLWPKGQRLGFPLQVCVSKPWNFLVISGPFIGIWLLVVVSYHPLYFCGVS